MARGHTVDDLPRAHSLERLVHKLTFFLSRSVPSHVSEARHLPSCRVLVHFSERSYRYIRPNVQHLLGSLLLVVAFSCVSARTAPEGLLQRPFVPAL